MMKKVILCVVVFFFFFSFLSACRDKEEESTSYPFLYGRESAQPQQKRPDARYGQLTQPGNPGQQGSPTSYGQSGPPNYGQPQPGQSGYSAGQNPYGTTDQPWRLTEKANPAVTSPSSGIEHGVRKAVVAVRYGMDWCWTVAGILIPGPLIILLVFGWAVGRFEKIIEGLALAGWGIFKMLPFVEAGGHADLILWVYLILIIPGILLFLWGCITSNEAGKWVLIGGPPAIFFLYCLGEFYLHFGEIIRESGIACFLILGGFLLILIVAGSLFGGSAMDKEKDPAAAHH